MESELLTLIKYELEVLLEEILDELFVHSNLVEGLFG
jgi:hypothetical protein